MITLAALFHQARPPPGNSQAVASPYPGRDFPALGVFSLSQGWPGRHNFDDIGFSGPFGAASRGLA